MEAELSGVVLEVVEVTDLLQSPRRGFRAKRSEGVLLRPWLDDAGNLDLG
jgi:hypothetical protein